MNIRPYLYKSNKSFCDLKQILAESRRKEDKNTKHSVDQIAQNLPKSGEISELLEMLLCKTPKNCGANRRLLYKNNEF